MRLSVVILTDNAEKHLPECLESVKDLADELVLLDGGSTDKTLEIAKKYNARVVSQKGKSYDAWRNQGAGEAKGDWLFYLDPDERVTPALRKAVEKITDHRLPITDHYVAYAIPRRNFVFGRELRHGGWYPDYVVRLIKKEALTRWKGELHEQPEVKGEVKHLKEPLVHLKEDSLSAMIEKTNRWSEIEARLLFEAGHPKMSWWRFCRVILSEIFDRLIVKRGFLDGVEGVVFSIYQGWSKFVTYTKLWEMQGKR